VPADQRIGVLRHIREDLGTRAAMLVNLGACSAVDPVSRLTAGLAHPANTRIHDASADMARFAGALIDYELLGPSMTSLAISRSRSSTPMTPLNRRPSPGRGSRPAWSRLSA
jgi:hypothetical protein